MTPLHIAARNGHTAGVEMLLNQEGIDINAVDGDGRTPLWYAKQSSDHGIVQLLKARGGRDCTSLHEAVNSGDLAVLPVLLQRGCSPNLKDEDGWSPLHW